MYTKAIPIWFDLTKIEKYLNIAYTFYYKNDIYVMSGQLTT